MRLFILIITFSCSFINLKIDKTTFYNALKSDSIEGLNHMLQQLEKEKQTSLNLAYTGTLLAKKASFEKKTKEKINVFKSGVKLLETEISNSPKEIEYRFLRLTLQENSPKILRYNKNIDEDISIITMGYAGLNKELKKIILNYSKNSTALKSSKLK